MPAVKAGPRKRGRGEQPAPPPELPPSTYAWREGSRYSVDPQTVGDELERIGEAHGGVVTPHDVVDASRPEDTPIHPLLEWNDFRAAELHRESQVRGVVRSIRVIREPEGDGDPQPRIAYVHVVVPDSGDKQGYITTARALTEQDLRQQVLNEALSGLEGWQRRYQELQDQIPEVFEAIERARARMARPAERRARPKG